MQLDQAIQAQEFQVKERYQQLEVQRGHWQKARSKEQAMESLVERYQDEELKVELRQEQLDNDERNTSQWVRRRSATKIVCPECLVSLEFQPNI